MLRYKADIKTLIYAAITTALLIVQWIIGDVQPILYVWCLFMAVAVSVIAHNHNHLQMWKSKRLNRLTDYWITLFYGFPAFAWIPTHNMNHHRENNKVGDHTRTYRFSEKNNLLTLLTYPTVSGIVQQSTIKGFIQRLWGTNRKRAVYYLSQLALLIVFLAVAFIVDWRKALLYIFIPQQVSLFAVLIFNYVQHVHANEEHKWDHSRNFVGWGLNAFLFNNGYHTVHHATPGLHWSRTPAAHAKVAHNIDPILNEPGFFTYLFRVYVLGIIIPRFRTTSMRLERIADEKRALGTDEALEASADLSRA